MKDPQVREGFSGFSVTETCLIGKVERRTLMLMLLSRSCTVRTFGAASAVALVYQKRTYGDDIWVIESRHRQSRWHRSLTAFRAR